MEKAKEKDDPTGTALTNPGIFMRLKSNILNRLPDEDILSFSMRELLTRVTK